MALASNGEMGEKIRPGFAGQPFDIVVIGGGINGVAIARECARAGKSVLLIEQKDFASGTTSRATRIIHGGLRYLEHGEISLVRESLRERERLLHEKSHLVRPLNFLLALPPDGQRSAMEVRFGLWLYRRFAGRPAVQAANESKNAVEKLLDSGQNWSVFAYEDAQCEFPERLVAEWLVEAVKAGAVACNYCEALSVETTNRTVTGVRARDNLTGHEFRVSCSSVINATGPWADSICSRSGILLDEPMIGGVRGAHILLPLFSGAPKAAVYTEAVDGRPIFVIPWAGQLLVGTTEAKDDADPGSVQPSAAEIDYLMRSFHRLFPSVPLTFADIRAAFAGVRPLPFVSDRSPASITRNHLLVDHEYDGAAGMISIIGGKLTTAASLAREVARALGIDAPEPSGFAVQDLDAAQQLLRQFEHSVAKAAGISPASAAAVVRWFGAASPEIANLARSSAIMRSQICPHTPHLVAEAVYAVHHEHAVSLGDILLRRVPVAFSPCWSDECTRLAAETIGTTLGWGAKQSGREQEQFAEEYSRFLAKPAVSSTSNSIVRP
jgi:glycerol-3-phosphate dehydrogenase